MKAKINIPFEVELGRNHGDISYPTDNRIGGSTYNLNGKGRTSLKAIINRGINDALDMKHNEARRVIMCGDGTVLVVSYQYSWEYHICHKMDERTYAGSCACGLTFDECLAYARQHAESSYGGVAWENSI